MDQIKNQETIHLAQRRCACCGKQKPIEQFGKHRQCRECLNTKSRKSYDSRYEREIDTAIEQGLIHANEREQARLLLKSCRSRFVACRNDNRGTYNKINCPYSSQYEFFVACIHKKGFFRAWKHQANIYLHTKNKNDRPVIDRIDEKGNYDMSNIQPLSHLENVTKATTKPIIFCLWERRGLKEVAKGSFNTISDVYKHVEGIYPTMTKKHVRELANVAIEYGEKEQGQPFEFEYNDKTYLVQIMYIDKQLKYQNERLKAFEAYERSLELNKAV